MVNLREEGSATRQEFDHGFVMILILAVIMKCHVLFYILNLRYQAQIHQVPVLEWIDIKEYCCHVKPATAHFSKMAKT